MLGRMRLDGLTETTVPFAERPVRLWRRSTAMPYFDVNLLVDVLKVRSSVSCCVHMHCSQHSLCKSTGGHRSQQPRVTEAQVAHFLEADLRPWAVAIAAKVFVPEPAQQPPFLTAAAAAAAVVSRAERREQAWQCLEELRPLDGAVDAVLLASEVPLLEQLRCTSAERQPAVIGSRVVAGALELSYRAAAACCDAMHAVRGVHTLTLLMTLSDNADNGDEDDSEKAEMAVQRACNAVPSLTELRTLRLLRYTSIPDSLAKGLPSCYDVWL